MAEHHLGIVVKPLGWNMSFVLVVPACCEGGDITISMLVLVFHHLFAEVAELMRGNTEERQSGVLLDQQESA